MNIDLEEQIIKIICTNIEKQGFCSIKEAAILSFYDNISMSEQKAIAKKLAKKFHFVTELNRREIVVKQNLSYIDNIPATDDFKFIKGIIAVVVAILMYIVFELFLPTIKK